MLVTSIHVAIRRNSGSVEQKELFFTGTNPGLLRREKTTLNNWKKKCNYALVVYRHVLIYIPLRIIHISFRTEVHELSAKRCWLLTTIPSHTLLSLTLTSLKRLPNYTNTHTEIAGRVLILQYITTYRTTIHTHFVIVFIFSPQS